MKSNSITNSWSDEDDAPELDIAFFEAAEFKDNGIEKPNPFKVKGRPKSLTTKKAVNIRLSQDVLDFFKSSGKGWQSRIDNSLLEIIKQPKQNA